MEITTSRQFYDIATHSGYLMDKYKGKVIYDSQYNRNVTVEYIFDLKFEDLDLADQKLAIAVGWAWGVGDHKDVNKCKKLKGYLFNPKQWRLWHATERFPAFIAAEGTGKTLIFWLYLVMLCIHYPGTRVLFMRESYPQLRDASLPTLWKIFDHFGWEEDKHFTHNKSDHIIYLHTGKRRSEILYKPAKNESGGIMDIIKDIRSLEIDCAIVDEIANIDEPIIKALRSRPGRWGKIPEARHRKMIVGGNPPPEGSWQHKRWYLKLNNDDTPLEDANEHTVFVASTYENRRNVDPAIIESLETSDQYWKNTFLYGQLGFVPPDGEPIYKNFNYNMYVSQKPLEHNPKLPLLTGWDIGPTAKNKACVVAQMDSKGSLIVLAEFMVLDPGVTKLGHVVLEQCNILFPGVPYWRNFCDPVAFDISQTDGKSPAMLLAEMGIDLYLGEESFQLRYEAVEGVLNRLIDGSPGMYIDGTRCRKLVEGFMGGYRYKYIDAPRQRFSREPIKDMYSHYHDALQYLCSRLFFIDTNKQKAYRSKITRRNPELVEKRRRLMGTVQGRG